MSIAQATSNVALARRWFQEMWNERRTEIIDELVLPESVCYSESGVLRGKQPFLDLVHGPFVTAFPDLQVNVDEVADAGDVVVVRWTATGTHTGDLPTLPATKRRITFRGMTWARFRDGKMLEGYDCWNQSGLFQAMTTGEAPPSISVT